MKNFTRRQFLKTSIVAGAALGAMPRFAIAKNSGSANGDIRVAVVGFNQRGQDHIANFKNMKGVRLVALCDVDQNVLDRELAKGKARGENLAGFTDIRLLLESKDIDAVSIATPNHWHSLAAIWSIQAGKDVYVEKPVSHNVWEGRKLVEAARKHGKIVQTGTQCRSSLGIREGMEWLHAGNIGKIKLARGTCYKRRPSIGKTNGPQPIPSNVNYDLWSGPAAVVPPHRNSPSYGPIHYDWHWIWDYGNGDLGNQGIHQMDLARWALGENELSPRVFSIGGRLGYDDDANTPNTLIICHEYKNAPLIFEVRGLPASSTNGKMDEYRGSRVGVRVECEHGSMVIANYTTATFYDTAGKEIKKFDGDANHYENFIKAVSSRKSSDLNADILEGHLSSALCHTGNISYKLGKTKSPDKIRSDLKNNPAMAETFGRMCEHLEANAVDIEKTPLTLGEHLKMNPKTERFTNNSKANKLLTREYRKPFVVPEKV